MPSALDLHAQLTADSKVWVRETQKAAKAFTNLANTTQKQANQTQASLNKLAKFLKGTLAVAIGFSLSRKIMQTAASLKQLGKSAVFSAGRINQMTSVLNMLGQKLGYTAVQMEGFTEAIRKKGIEMGIAQNTLQEFIRYEMDLTKSTQLARVAQDAAVMSNSNSSETLQRLIYGIARQNSLILRNAGIQVMAGQAIDQYATSLGKSAQALTTTERTQAVLNAVLKEGIKIEGAYEKSLEEPLKKLGSLVRVYDDISLALGQTMYPVFKTFVNKGLDPFVKGISALVAEGSTLNDWLTRLGENSAKSLQSLIDFAQSEAGDSFREIANSAGEIAKQLLGIVAVVKPLSKILVSTGFLNAAFETFAKVLEAVAVIAKPLAPLLQGLIVMKMVERVTKMAQSTKVYAQVLALEYKEKLLSAHASRMYGTANAMAIPPTTGLALATTALSVALKSILPLLAAFAAMVVITKVLSAIVGGADKTQQKIDDLSRSFKNATESIEASDKALDDWIDTNSRFKTRNQLDDLEALANSADLTRDAFRDLLGQGTSGLDQFVAAMAALGGEQGLTKVDAHTLEEINTYMENTNSTLEQGAKEYDAYADSQGNVLEGNIDLIKSFKEEQKVIEGAARAFVASKSAESKASADLVNDVLGDFALRAGKDAMFVRDMKRSSDLRGAILSEEIDLGLDWIEVREALIVATNEHEEALAAEAKEIEDAIKLENELLDTAKKLAGIKGELTGKTKAFYFAIAQEQKEIEGLNEAIDGTAERLQIFSSQFTGMIEQAQMEAEVMRGLAEATKLAGDSSAKAGASEKKLYETVRKSTQVAIAKAKQTMKANGIVEDSVEADKILREAIEDVTQAMRNQVGESGILREELDLLIKQLFNLDGFSAEIKIVTDMGLDASLEGFQIALEQLKQNSKQYGEAFTSIIPFLEESIAIMTEQVDEIQEQISSLKTVKDIEDLILQDVNAQVDERKRGLSAMFRWVRAEKDLRDVNQSIVDLEKEKADLLSANNNFYLEAELSVLRQERSLKRLTETLAELTELNEEIKTIAELEQTVADLTKQSAEVTDVELELIKVTKDLAKINAKAGDITAIEAREIEELAIALKATIRQHEHGVASSLELMSAEQSLTEAIEEALLPSEELAEATEELNRLKIAAETIDLDLAIAEKELKLATNKASEALSAEQAVMEQLVITEDNLRDASMQQVTATNEVEDAMVELAREGRNVEEELKNLRDGNFHLNREFGNLVDGINSARIAAEALFPEFETLRFVLDHIEIQGLDEHGVNKLYEDIKTAMENGQDIMDKIQLMAAIRASVDGQDWSDWEKELQAILDEWNLETVVKVLFDMDETPSFPSTTSPTSPDAAGSLGELASAMTWAETINWFDKAGAFKSPLDKATALQGWGTWHEGHYTPPTGYIPSGVKGPNFPSAAIGGFVNSSGLASVHAGETIVPADLSRLNGGGTAPTYNINVGAGVSDPSAVAEAVVEALRAYERGNGPVPVTTVASMYTASA
jgi:hypothetical protein